MNKLTILAIGLIAVATVACSAAGSSASPDASVAPAPSTAVGSASPDATPGEPTTAPVATPDACAAADLPLLAAGTLTIGTDNPAYPPYFATNDDGSKTAPWKLGDPTNGMGFESAFAYALAERLGFTADQVAWTYVPFTNSFKPGAKEFDVDINQISYRPRRAEAVDMSDGYYFLNQAIVSVEGNPITGVTSIADLAGYRLGAQVGTTSFETITDVVNPTQQPSVYDSNDAAIAALKARQIDGIVVDLPTAFYMAAAQLKRGVVVGQFQLPDGAEAEHFSVVLPKGSALTACVDAAIAAMTADGSLAAITQEWLSDKVSAPVFTP
jgi:polar amino acid transport system substrate-binding protein